MKKYPSENAIKDRLKNLALEQKREFNNLLKQLYLERFLARLAQSDFADHFIFKGGQLLSYYLKIGRETKDLDFLVQQVKTQSADIESIFRNICSVNIEDGFKTVFLSITILKQPHMIHHGFRIIIKIQHIKGTLKDNLQIDLGVGDTVISKKLAIPLLLYNSEPFFEDKISLQVYPPEFIFAEKLTAIISRGKATSRMKDFHDVILMIRKSNLLKINLLKEAVNQVFHHKKLEKKFPIEFDDVSYQRLEEYWKQHQRGLRKLAKDLKLPDRFKDLVSELNAFLSKTIH